VHKQQYCNHQPFIPHKHTNSTTNCTNFQLTD
jgi:hypothetical protein